MKSCSKKILIVDDDVTIRRILRRLLDADYCLAEAQSGEEALAKFAEFAPDLVMLDIMLPGIDGYEVCRRMRSHPCANGIQIVMLSAKSSREEQSLAYTVGADDYVVKPFDPYELRSRVRLHFRLRCALDTIAINEEERSVPADAALSVDQVHSQFLLHAHDAMVAALTTVAELRDKETGGHLIRMRSYAQIIAEELGRDGPYANQIDDRFLADLYRASPLHDIGKVGISDAILLKPSGLTPEEFEAMKKHASIGGSMLDRVAFDAPGASFLAMAADVARYHHERYDGSGYPTNLRGTEIPLAARIVAIADAFDAITSARPYHEAQSPAAAKEVIRQDSGSHFDPVIVDAFLRRFDAVAIVHKQTCCPPAPILGDASLLSASFSAAWVCKQSIPTLPACQPQACSASSTSAPRS